MSSSLPWQRSKKKHCLPPRLQIDLSFPQSSDNFTTSAHASPIPPSTSKYPSILHSLLLPLRFTNPNSKKKSAQPLSNVPVNSTTPAMSFASDSTSSTETSPAVQPLHQGNLASLEVQRQLLAQKLADKYITLSPLSTLFSFTQS